MGKRLRFFSGVVLLACCAGMLIGLLLGQLYIAKTGRQQLRHYTHALLVRGMAVAEEQRYILEAVRSPGTPLCSDADLNQLRFLLVRAAYIADIGRVLNGKSICSAARGAIDVSSRLPPPDTRITANRIMQGQTLVVTDPLAFSYFYKSSQGYSGLLAARNLQSIYQSFGYSDVIRANPGRREHPWWATAHFEYECDDRSDICAYSQLQVPSIFQAPPAILAGLLFISMAIGGSACAALLLAIEKYRSLNRQLFKAVKRKQIEVRYQPLMCLRRGKFTAVEALARWKNHRGEYVSPEIFIKMAEDMGIIGLITRQITRQALRDMYCFMQADSEFYVSINVSVSDLLSAAYHDFLDNEIRKLNLDPRQVMLEITERSTSEHGGLAKAIGTLRNKGFKIALDDFGTGYSNLDYLSSLTVDAIKIDKIFTNAIGTDSINAKMVDLLFDLIQFLQLAIIVEGIETAGQAEYVAAHCPDAIGQGWYYSYPLRVDELAEKMPHIRPACRM
ncbi:EAL domain-containing protein [Sodalis sp. RH21]|uniref:EAL domain-containing protein n=1 Tax=unclassified Sodalis (in: enterobacteria) TaxID=2636512 RepID=UPI0039B696AB